MAKVNNNSGGSLFGKITALLMLVVTVFFAICLLFVVQAQDLSDIEGYLKNDEQSSTRDLTTVLEKAIDGQYSVEVTEREINKMLESRLELNQGGVFASSVTLKQVLIRLRDGYAEVIVVRDIVGKEFTGSLFVQLEQLEDRKGIKTEVHLHGGNFHSAISSPKRGGKFGKLTVPQGFLMLLMPEFRKIAEALEPEIRLGFKQMARFKVEEGLLTLDPRSPVADGGPVNESF